MGMYLVAQVIPMVTTQVATFSVIQSLGAQHDVCADSAVPGADVLQIVIYLQFVNSIPRDLDESAMLEGRPCSKSTVPSSSTLAPATATLVILKSISIYNDFTRRIYICRAKT